ncbi:MAG: class C sortase [Clostridiales bacterium]|nr:class C sortase [Clostridiales bacterium]
MRRQNPVWLWLAILLGLLAGLWLLFYPQLQTATFERESALVIDQWQEQTEAARSQLQSDTEGNSLLYPELYQAMADYNQVIFLEHQSGLTGASAYETPALELSDYGLESGSPVGYLTIPAIDLELPVYLGANAVNMALGAAVLGQTSLPIGGESTNCVLAGHRGYRGIPYFRYLDQLEPGDLVCLTSFWDTMTYQVVETAIIQPDDVDAILIREGQDLLTLLTCHPYTVGTQRLVVYCERID